MAVGAALTTKEPTALDAATQSLATSPSISARLPQNNHTRPATAISKIHRSRYLQSPTSTCSCHMFTFHRVSVPRRHACWQLSVVTHRGIGCHLIHRATVPAILFCTLPLTYRLRVHVRRVRALRRRCIIYACTVQYAILPFAPRRAVIPRTLGHLTLKSALEQRLYSSSFKRFDVSTLQSVTMAIDQFTSLLLPSTQSRRAVD